ncbi:MAG: hypothetical protein HKN16_08840 [Saprospiraceae bacterium]|nr:hypothetical protein [Saprospiraceae bacterium]
MSEGKYVKQSYQFNASVADVWDALINPEKTRQYMFGCDPVTGWIPGEALDWVGAEDGITYVKGKLVQFDPPFIFSMTTYDPSAPIQDDYHVVGEYKLSHENGITTMEISQGDFSKVTNGDERFEEAKKSWKSAMEVFRKVVES